MMAVRAALYAPVQYPESVLQTRVKGAFTEVTPLLAVVTANQEPLLLVCAMIRLCPSEKYMLASVGSTRQCLYVLTDCPLVNNMVRFPEDVAVHDSRPVQVTLR